ncbi:MAG: argininosuccinate lyase [Elusimicrobiota bacterium]|jgi:argininosuccinate lyase|nr:argininosuccinate lyase [Elusimicrobiota bacterium]
MLWDGRFSKDLNKKVVDFTNSIEIDKILYKYDIQGSLVHVKSMNKIGVINDEELKKINDALIKVLEEFEKNKFKFLEDDEDIHMAIERRLTELIGEVGKKLHTGRSRNDQVNLDVRMFVKDIIKHVEKKLDILIESLVNIAEKNKNIVMPGYTHLQQAQPVLFSHYILAYANKFLRNKKNFENACISADIYPLGAGALAGTPYNIDRLEAANFLGFSKISENSMDVISDRDFILDFLYASTSFAINCSRLAEDFIIYSSQEFGFFEMDDAYTTGSSIMPQKKNPDIMELIRGKSQRIIGSFNAFANLMKGLPMTYNRDMQDDKFYLLQVTKILEEFLEILPDALASTKFKADVMKNALDKGFLYATAIVDYLVKQNIPFREAHKITGNVVRFCIENKKTFTDLTLEAYKKFSPVFEDDIFSIFDANKIINEQLIHGSTSLKSIEKQILNLRKIVR